MKYIRKGRLYKAVSLFLCLTLLFSLYGCKGKIPEIEQKPYVCYYPLDWGMTVEECITALDITPEALRSASGTSPCGFPSIAYMGTVRMYDFMSDVTLWFTSYKEGEEEGLSSIIIANPFMRGERVEKTVSSYFDAYKAPVTSEATIDDHPGTSIPFTTVSVVWKASPLSEMENSEFPEKWNALLEEKGIENKEVVASLTEATLKYMQGDLKYRLDIRGEPAAYYNYLNKKGAN